MQSLIEKQTPLLPELIAGIVLDACNINTDENRALLVNKAEYLYATKERFKRSLNAKGNDGRANLYMWFRHWAEVIQKSTPESINRFFNIPKK